MSFYDIVFGDPDQRTKSLVYIHLLSLGPDRFGRFRDAFVANGEIAVYTRCGGPNRSYLPAEIKDHPNFLRIVDDTFDSTYATVYFSIPDEFKEVLAKFDSGPFDPDKRWKDAIAEMQKPSYRPPPAVQQLMSQLDRIGNEGADSGPTIIEI